MRLTHLGHACLLVESGGARVLIDPGTFASGWDGLTDLDAVLVTHAHPDHVDWTRLPALLADNPRARLMLEQELAATDEARSWTASSIAAGDTATVADLTVEAVGGRHAVIHADVPRIGNVGLLLRDASGSSLFHPGDSYEAVPEGVDVLAVPLNAPWAAAKETIDFARAVAPRVAVPIHDGLLSDTGRGLYVRMLTGMGGRAGAPLDVRDLRNAGSVDVSG